MIIMIIIFFFFLFVFVSRSFESRALPVVQVPAELKTTAAEETREGGRMARVALLVVVSFLSLAAAAVRAEDPYLYFTWRVTSGTIAPLGVPQKGILINGQFPGPNINSTTNNNIVINVFNDLDEPFLLSW